MEIMHIGVPVKEPRDKEEYAEGLKVYIESPDTNPMKFEYLRFEEDTPMHKDIVENVHIAYKVDSLDAYINDYELLYGPLDIDDSLTIAFIKMDGAVLELMQFN
ncbi:hypothetical protein [Clostridium sp. DL1XJH146]